MKINIKQTLLTLLAVPLLALSVTGVVSTTAFAGDDKACADGNAAVSGLTGSAECAKGGGQATDLFGPTGIFKTITNVLLFIIGAISVIMLVIGGVRYTISQGDSSAVTSAKNTILYAIIGLIVAILAYAIVNFVISQFTAAPAENA